MNQPLLITSKTVLFKLQELSTVLKSMGYNPTIEEIKDMVEQVRIMGMVEQVRKMDMVEQMRKMDLVEQVRIMDMVGQVRIKDMESR